MFKVKITASTAAELRLKVLDLVNQLKAVNVTKVPEEEIKPVIPIEEMEQNMQAAPEHKAPEAPSIEEVRTALKDLRERKGAGAVRDLLKAYGAENLTQLKEEDYAGALSRALTEV